MAVELFVPKLGQTVEEVTLVKWLLPDGAQVSHGQEVAEVETDKAVFAIEANAKGILHLGPYKAGEVLPVLTVIAVIGRPDDKFEVKAAAPSAAPAAPAAKSEPDDAAPPATAAVPAKVFASPRARRLAAEKEIDLAQVKPTGGGGTRVVEHDVAVYLSQRLKATPLAQKLAVAAGLDLGAVVGTGPRGKIMKEDVARLAEAPRAAAEATLPPVEVAESLPLTGARRLIAERMGTSVHTTARVTLFMEVDATELVTIRTRLKERVEKDWGFAPGYNDLLAKMVAAALRKHPRLNARLTPTAVERLAHVNLGMAVDTDRGLLVPVIPDADQKSLRQFGTEFRALVESARSGRISPDHLTGGTFTITNLGMYEVDAFTPVINLPEAAILGVGQIKPKPVVWQGAVAVRQMWILCLVFDHRLVDGAPAAQFLQYLKQLIEEPYLLL